MICMFIVRSFAISVPPLENLKFQIKKKKKKEIVYAGYILFLLNTAADLKIVLSKVISVFSASIGHSSI